MNFYEMSDSAVLEKSSDRHYKSYFAHYNDNDYDEVIDALKMEYDTLPYIQNMEINQARQDYLYQPVHATKSLEKAISNIKAFQVSKRPLEVDRFMESISWEGFVQSIDKEAMIFTGRMKEIEKDSIDVHVEFSYDDVSDDDKPLLKNGAIFYYTIGYAVVNGQRMKQSILKFKRSLPFSEKDVDSITANAHSLVQGLNWQ